MSTMTDPAAFLLLYQEPTRAVADDARAATMSQTLVNNEEPDEDEDYGPAAGTKTLTEVREETDDDETATSYGAVPQRRVVPQLRSVRRATATGTQTMQRDGKGSTDHDLEGRSAHGVPIAGTRTYRTDNSGSTDEDESVPELRAIPVLRDRVARGIRAGTQTMTKSTEEGNDSDPTAPAFAAVPRRR